jgi:flagellar hook-associated protein 2
MDTEAVISQLMALEALPKNRMVSQQRLAEGRKTALEDVARQLRALNTAIGDLRSATTWGDVQTLTSSDAAKVTARQVGSAPPGNVTVKVTQLARVEQRFYDWGMPDASFSIDGKAIDTTGVTDAAGLAAKINATSGITVYAGVMNGDLVLTGKTLGQAIDVQGKGALVDGTVVAALATQYSINDVPQPDTVATVVQPPGLPGVELTFKDVAPAGVTLSVTPPGPDPEKVKAKVKAFVEVYNSTVDLVRGKLGEAKVKDPSVTSDFVKGQLRGDPALTSLLTQLRQAVGPVNDLTAGIDTLAEIGVGIEQAKTGTKATPEALAGKLKLDEAKLASALASDPAAVEQLLGSGQATGVAQTLEGILDPVTKAATGYLARNSTTADADIARAKDRQADFDRRLALREERLRSMFTAMETALNASQTQSSWLTGQLGGLPSWGE